MNHGRSCYLTWMRGAIWRAATSLPSQPEAAVGRQKYRSRLLLRMPRFASNLARPARKVKHTLACAAPPSVSSRPRVRFRSTQTSALGRHLPRAVGDAERPLPPALPSLAALRGAVPRVFHSWRQAGFPEPSARLRYRSVRLNRGVDVSHRQLTLRFGAPHGRPRNMDAVRTMGRGRARDTATVPVGLRELGDMKSMAEALVLDDGPLIDDAELVVGRVGDRGTAAPNLNASIGVLENVDVLTNESPVLRRIRDQIELAIIVQRQVLRHLAQFPPREDQIKVFIFSNGAVRVVAIPRHLAELCVVRGDERRHERVGGLDAGDALEPQLLDQAVLQRLVRSFDTTLGRRRIRADPVDIEFIERPAKLRVPGTCGGIFLVHPKYTGFVAVERQRLAMSIDIFSGGFVVAKGGLGTTKRVTIKRLVASST